MTCSNCVINESKYDVILLFRQEVRVAGYPYALVTVEIDSDLIATKLI